MLKFIIGMIIVGLIVFISRQIWKQTKIEKRQETDRANLTAAKEELQDLAMREDVLNIKEKVVKQKKKVQTREKAISEKESKLDQ